MPFGFIKKVDPQTLLQFIGEEHPQTIALLLCHLPTNYAAEVLAGLPLPKQIEVIRRVATIGRTSPEAVTELENGLEQRLSSMVNQGIPPPAEWKVSPKSSTFPSVRSNARSWR